MLFKNRNSLKTAYKATILRAFFDADASTVNALAMVKLTGPDNLPEQLKGKQEIIEKRRYDFIYSGTKVGPITFDDFYDFIMGDRFNNDLLTRSFGERDKIKQFIDFYLVDSWTSASTFKLQNADSPNAFVPAHYLVFFVEDTSYLNKIVEYYKERNMKVDFKEVGEIVKDFYLNYCKSSRFTLSDYFYHKI